MAQQMVKKKLRKWKRPRSALRGLTNVAKTIEKEEADLKKALKVKEEERSPPRKRLILTPKTPLNPCMASTDLTIAGQTGKHNRYTMRTDLEVRFKRISI